MAADPDAALPIHEHGLYQPGSDGEFSLERYLDQRVAEAVRELPDGLSCEEREFVRRCLRSELQHDPALRQWVRLATGRGLGPE